MNVTQMSALLEAQQYVIEKIALGENLAESLTTICQQIEIVLDSPHAKSSILLLRGKKLRHGAAPQLPKAYCDAIDGIVIGPSVGSCGTAAFTGKQVIVSDIEKDPLWSDFKSIALEYELRACWSTPIMSSQGDILGSFAIYYSKTKLPDSFHLDLIARFTHLSSFAIEKQHNEAELRDSENYRRLLFNASTIGHSLCRLDGHFVDVNSSYAKIIGRSVEETLKLSFWDITPDKYHQAELHQAKSLDASGSYGPFEKEYIHKNGHLVYVRLSGRYLDIDGERFIWSSIEDITQQKQSEKILRRTQKMDAIGQLTGGIAHDFNNILGIIMGNLEFLKNEIPDDAKVIKRVNSIDKAAQRAVDLTRQLLSFSRKQESKRSPTDISKLIKNMNNLITRSITPEVEVDQKFANDLWLTEIDPGAFEDVLLNLTLNARDAMPDGGQLTIETRNCFLEAEYCDKNPGIAAGEYVQLILSDTGVGIASEFTDRIFEPFFTTKPEGKGTGLGLAMVFGFVKRSKGHIRVYSGVGIGTTFRIYLPRIKKKLQPSSGSHEHNITLSVGHEIILAVDDEQALLVLAKESLELLGYHVLTATNGQQALGTLEKNSEVALLFSDVVMPGGLSGYELAEQATKQYPKLKILLTSGYTEKAIAHSGQARFNANLLSKPYTQSELSLQIRSLLNENKSSDLSINAKQQQPEKIISQLEWSEDFSIGNSMIDNDHKILFGLLNQCFEIDEQNCDKQKIEGILIELMDYTKTHFQKEEKAMKVCNYPGQHNHCNVHKILVEQVTERQRQLARGDLTLQKLASFLTDWWVDHIRGMDGAFGLYCNKDK